MNDKLNIRVKEYKKGWSVEIKIPKRSFFGTKYIWVHLISVSGISDIPWYYSSKEIAITETLKLVKWNILDNSF